MIEYTISIHLFEINRKIYLFVMYLRIFLLETKELGGKVMVFLTFTASNSLGDEGFTLCQARLPLKDGEEKD